MNKVTTTDQPCVIRLLGLVNKSKATPHDGRYLVEYDPWWLTQRTPDGLLIRKLVTSDDPAKARVFDDFVTAFRTWNAVAPNQPTKPDGLPNRPLAAFNVEFLQVEESR